MKLRILLSAWLALLAGLTLARAADPAPTLIPVEEFFRYPEISQVRISPDGKAVAFLIPVEGRMEIVLFDLKTGKSAALARAFDYNIRSFFWKGSDNIVFMGDVGGNESEAIFSVAVQNPSVRTLSVSFRDGQDQSSYVATVINELPFDPHNVLVVGQGSSKGSSFGLYRLNIITGDRRVVAGYERETGGWMVDHTGELRVQYRYVGKNRVLEAWAGPKGPWRTIAETPADVGTEINLVTALAFNADNDTLYLIKIEPTGGSSLYGYHVSDGQWGKPLFHVDGGEILRISLSPDRRRLISVTSVTDREHTTWFDPARERLMQTIDASLPGMDNQIISTSDDEKAFIIHAGGDVNPGAYYLLDLHGRTQFVELGKVNSHLKSVQLRPMQPIVYRARDGLEIHGYLTLPAGAEGRRVPLIINPHGGPYGIRDYWGYERDVQFLASRGYAVLQPNYRGSGGYGLDFLQAGRREWGRKMQDDLTDAVAWAVKEGIADPNRVAIYGASYGGYAALAGAAFTPDLYRCAVNYVGVSDLALITNWQHRGETGMDLFYQTWVGNDKELVHDRSPVNFVDRIKIPTLHGYGMNDPRVEFRNWTRLEAELKRYGKVYEAVVEEKEGHGFNDEGASIRFYRAVDLFLAKYLLPEGHVEVGVPVPSPTHN
jgi:dipeptidyl aminopeptidase/acylaminoacyl peptidase